MALSDQELDKLLAVLSPTGTDYQAGRIVRLLAKGPNRTGIIAAQCSVGNLPNVVLKTINPIIMPLGYFVSCVKPPMIIRNQFGQVAGDWLYTLHKVNKAANDDSQGSSADDWFKELEVVFDDAPVLPALDALEPNLSPEEALEFAQSALNKLKAGAK